MSFLKLFGNIAAMLILFSMAVACGAFGSESIVVGIFSHLWKHFFLGIFLLFVLFPFFISCFVVVFMRSYK